MDKNTLQTQRLRAEAKAAGEQEGKPAPGRDPGQNAEIPASPENNAAQDQPQSAISEEVVSQQGGETDASSPQNLRETIAPEAIREQLMELDVIEDQLRRMQGEIKQFPSFVAHRININSEGVYKTLHMLHEKISALEPLNMKIDALHNILEHQGREIDDVVAAIMQRIEGLKKVEVQEDGA